MTTNRCLRAARSAPRTTRRWCVCPTAVPAPVAPDPALVPVARP